MRIQMNSHLRIQTEFADANSTFTFGAHLRCASFFLKLAERPGNVYIRGPRSPAESLVAEWLECSLCTFKAAGSIPGVTFFWPSACAHLAKEIQHAARVEPSTSWTLRSVPKVTGQSEGRTPGLPSVCPEFHHCTKRCGLSQQPQARKISTSNFTPCGPQSACRFWHRTQILDRDWPSGT